MGELPCVFHRPMVYERPAGLWMAEQDGSVTAHSYHTCFPLLQRQNRTVTSSSRDTLIGC